jgi:tRNA nucleotidyltransferase (CCA-adding enzyme)
MFPVNFVPPELDEILRQTPELQRAYLVGGCVRDALAGFPHEKDFDVEVFGLDYEQLMAALARWGKTDLVGRSFGVVKLSTHSGYSYDFTLPRRDSKVAAGHKGFDIQFEPDISLPEAASRRDFTINSIMFDPRARQVLDFFGGAADLKNRILRHTSPAFVEDPLRVLRGMQFAGRFELRAAPETVELSRSIKGSYGELAVERVREEWLKWAQRSRWPSAGLRFLAETEWIDHFPEIKALIGTPQEPEWHPEGDVFTHTCHCCDALVRLPGWREADAESKAVYMFAILAHDFGKPATTHRAVKDGRERIISPGHEEAGVGLTKTFLERIRAPLIFEQRIVPLVRNHLVYLETFSDRAIRRLARRLAPESIESLCLVMTADSMGRPPRPPEAPAIVKILLDRAHELEVRQKPPEPILMGRHLLPLGLSPGKQLGEVLEKAYEAQLEGTFSDLEGALTWVEKKVEEEVAQKKRSTGTMLESGNSKI